MTQSCGMALVYSTIATVPWTMQRKHFPLSSEWIKVGLFENLILASVNYEDLDFDKANEILFHLGIIYKQQGKYDKSLTCFGRILRNPPNPLAHVDIWSNWACL